MDKIVVQKNEVHLAAIRHQFLEYLKPLANALSPILKDKHSSPIN